MNMTMATLPRIGEPIQFVNWGMIIVFIIYILEENLILSFLRMAFTQMLEWRKQRMRCIVLQLVWPRTAIYKMIF